MTKMTSDGDEHFEPQRGGDKAIEQLQLPALGNPVGEITQGHHREYQAVAPEYIGNDGRIETRG